MGGKSSKSEETDNTGMLNGNFINNGNIVEKIEKDISSETLLLKVIIVLKTIHILIILVKAAIKYIKKRESQSRQMEEIILRQNRSV